MRQFCSSAAQPEGCASRAHSRLRACWLACVLLAASGTAGAVGTAAGTLIQTGADVTMRFATGPVTVHSNAPLLVVDQILEVGVTALTGLVPVQSGDAGRVAGFRLTNVGNGPEPLRLALATAVAGNGFDVLPHAPAIYLDSDKSGTYTPADVGYAPGTNDPVIPADGSLVVFVVFDVPAGLNDTARSHLDLSARALAGSGTPGTFFPGTGVGGVDALAGVTGGAGKAGIDVVISGFDVAVAKSATVVDAAGGSRPEPGARIDYDLAVQASGTSPAHALVVSDPIPVTTNYVAGSLTLDGVALTDAADGDAGSFLTGPNRIEVSLGDLAPGLTRHIRFSVLIP